MAVGGVIWLEIRLVEFPHGGAKLAPANDDTGV